MRCKRRPMPSYMFSILPAQNLSTRHNNAISPEDHVWPLGLISLRDSGAIAVLPTTYNRVVWNTHCVSSLLQGRIFVMVVPWDSSFGAHTLTGIGRNLLLN